MISQDQRNHFIETLRTLGVWSRSVMVRAHP